MRFVLGERLLSTDGEPKEDASVQRSGGGAARREAGRRAGEEDSRPRHHWRAERCSLWGRVEGRGRWRKSVLGTAKEGGGESRVGGNL